MKVILMSDHYFVSIIINSFSLFTMIFPYYYMPISYFIQYVAA